MRKSTLFILVLAILMIGIGIYREEAETVYHKGINVCLECVGIG